MLIEKFRARLEKLTVPEEVMKTINEELVCFNIFFFFLEQCFLFMFLVELKDEIIVDRASVNRVCGNTQLS